ncbi:hypothetical protein FRC01_001001 [Tulasnella sp. 417]|nr:hypothetical protein FRC01_001001 [Tulasnella sp. 417]
MSFINNRSGLFAASLVCKTWSPIALSHLWRALYSVVPLCKLLGPMTSIHDWYLGYTDTISEANWTRFEFYSQKIRKICGGRIQATIEAGSMIQLLNSRPPSIRYILPRVTEIEWMETNEIGWLPQLVPLLSPTLKSFTLHSSSDRISGDIDTIVILRHLAFLPGLKLEKLEADWIKSTEDIDTALCDILDRQRESLMIFSHKSFDLSERFSASISRLRSLLILELDFSDSRHPTDRDFNNFSDALASRCSELRVVQFRTVYGAPERTFYAFQPLTRIKEMKFIQIHCSGLVLELQDLQEMGASWRSLAVLGFSYCEIPLPWLSAIARHFSSTLEVIDVNLLMSEDIDHDHTTLTPFSSVKRVRSLADVPPESIHSVGSFFQRLVAPGTIVECSYGTARRLTEAVGSLVRWRGKWKDDEDMSSPGSPVS